MKLETDFVIYKKYQKKEIDACVQTLLKEVAAFGNILTNRALWVNEDTDCVYVKSTYGRPSCGDKISCKGMPKVLKRWFRDIAEWAVMNPDPDTEGDDDDDRFVHREYSVTIEDGDVDLGLRIRFIDSEGETDHEIVFVEAEKE